MSTEPQLRTSRFPIFGHRGSRFLFRENSLASFDAALEGGADGIETDLRRLRDGSIVLFHDTTHGGRLTDGLTWDELAADNPELARLDELRGYASRTRLILEVKSAGWEEELARAVDGWPGIVISSFDHRIPLRLRQLGVRAELGAVAAARFAPAAAYVASLGVEWFFPEWEFVDAAAVGELHDAGITVVPWTANSPPAWERLREAGCDGVITDYPHEAVQHARSTGVRLC
jgi:glycerophosphoryl diester phosphodiesterase